MRGGLFQDTHRRATQHGWGGEGGGNRKITIIITIIIYGRKIKMENGGTERKGKEENVVCRGANQSISPCPIMEKPLSTRGTVGARRKVDKEIGSTCELDSIQFKNLVHMIFENKGKAIDHAVRVQYLPVVMEVDLRCLPLQPNLQYRAI